MMDLKRARQLLACIALESDDPDTQTACFAVAPNGGLLLSASNQLPPRVERKPERLMRPAKYQFIEHAEKNLAYSAARLGVSLEGCTLYLNWFPCRSCVMAILSMGITALVADRAAYEARKDDPRYEFAEAVTLLAEANVEVRWL